MAKQQLRVSQQWQRHFDAPVAITRTSAASGHILAVDEDGGVHLLDIAGIEVLSRGFPWVPSAAALDEDARRLAVISASGTLVVFDRGGRTLNQMRVAWRPSYLDMTPNGDHVAFVDGSGKVGTVELGTGKVSMRDDRWKYYYVKYAAGGTRLLACGDYGQVLFAAVDEESGWQKDFHCHTRTPSLSASGDIILIPSPHYGVIALRGDGTQIGLLDVPEGPRAVAVDAAGQTIFTVNEKNELIIFEPDGKVSFRQPLGSGVAYFESDAAGESITAMMSSGAIERFAVGAARGGDAPYIEFAGEAPEDTSKGPSVVWRTKVFSALGGARGGQLAVTPGARHVALLDINSQFRIFDQSGAQTSEETKIPGRTPVVKAARSQDLVVAASSDALLAVDLRSYRQRRLTLRNEWTTHFDIAPRGVFLAVADFFRGISFFDETLDRIEYLETADDVAELAVDGQHHVMAAFSGGGLAFYSEKGAPLAEASYQPSAVTAVCGLGQGFAVASKGRVETFTTNGARGWSSDVPGEVSAVTPTPTGLVVSTADGTAYVTNALGTLISKLMRRSSARFFGARGEAKGVVSVEYRGRLLTARSTESGVLWRREMDDETLAMEVSPEGGFVALLSGVYLYVLSTAVGEEAPHERLYLEI